jgi:calpain-15
MQCSQAGFLQRGGGGGGGGGLCRQKKRDPGLLLANCLLTPFLLAYQSVRIYLLPCLESIVFMCCCALLSRICCKCCWRHADRRFPATAASLGDYEAKRRERGDASGVVWKRAHEIVDSIPRKQAGCCGSSAPQLFGGDIDPRDICQGQLGDCWLLSAIACLAERDGTIQRVFSEATYNPRGKYHLRLFDGSNGCKPVRISVDDRFPCAEGSGVPMFSNPGEKGHIWVCLIEKAFAKMANSYAALEGGHSLWALEAMTGRNVRKYSLDEEDQRWRSFALKHAGKSVHECEFPATGANFSCDGMFAKLVEYDKAGFALGAGSLGKDTTRTDDAATAEEKKKKSNGIVPGHAYSILKVRDTGGFKLLCLRNPWGSFEWKGDWSDASPLWKKHPLMRSQLTDGGVFSKQSDKDDGIFWMAWPDFLKFFDSVDVCEVERGIHDLTLNTHEEHGMFGPVLGCVGGCLTYWLCCCGLYKLWCSRDSTELIHKDENVSSAANNNKKKVAPAEMSRNDFI